MFLNQLSVFLENREGRLDQVLNTLRNNGINIVSLSLADTSDYGMLRMIVANPETAKAVLREAGFSAMLTPVMGVKLAHKAGSLQECLSELSKEGINIEYMYAFSQGDAANVIIRPDNIEKCADVLKANKLELIAASELYKL